MFIIPFWVYPDPNFLLDIQFNYDQSMYGFREFFKRHGIKYSDPIWTCWWVWYSNAMLSRTSNCLTLTKVRGFDEWHTFLFNELLCLVLILLVVSHMADISQAWLLHTLRLHDDVGNCCISLKMCLDTIEILILPRGIIRLMKTWWTLFIEKEIPVINFFFLSVCGRSLKGFLLASS